MYNGVPTTAAHMCKARNRSHKGMLYGTFPALYGDHISDTIKGNTEIGPDRCSNQQVQRERINLSLTHLAQHLCIFADQGDTESVNRVINKPHELPASVARGQLRV